MASNTDADADAVTGDDHNNNNNTETEEDGGTLAQHTKRNRRVSFAEMTSIHFFDKDEDSETPLNSKSNDNAPLDLGHLSDDLGFLSQSLRNEEEDVESDEEIDPRGGFLRPVESPSPGSTIGSATSNDEDFFGPVSAGFIRPGRLSGSATSDDNHDLTMDSTAFSMHFRSLARSDSAGDLKTPSGIHLAFEEKTPLSTNVGSSMVLTEPKKPISPSSMPVVQLSSGHVSSDMSLVGDNPYRYDFDKLSPGLDALLAEGSKDVLAVPSPHNISASRSPSKSKDVHAVSISHNMSGARSPSNMEIMRDSIYTSIMESKFLAAKELGGLPMDPGDNGKKETDAIDIYDVTTEPVSTVHNKLCETIDGSITSPITCGLSSSTSLEHPDTYVDHQDLSPNKLIKGMLADKNPEYVNNALEMKRPDMDLSTVRQGTPSDVDNKVQHGHTQYEGESPLSGFKSSAFATGGKKLFHSPSPTKYPLIVTPSQNQPFFVSNADMIQDRSVMSIQKSISKLTMLETSPFISTLNAKIDNLKLRSLDHLLRTPPVAPVLGKKGKDSQVKLVDASITPSEEHLLSVTQKQAEQKVAINMDRSRIETLKNFGEVSHNKESVGLVNSGKSPCHVSTGISCTDQAGKLVAAAISPSKFSSSGKMMQQSLLAPEDPTGETLVTSGTDSSLAVVSLDYLEEKKSMGIPKQFVSSPERFLDKKSLTSPKYQGSHFRNLRLHDQDNELINFGPGRDAASNANAVNASLSTTNADNLSSLLMDWTSSHMIETSYSKELHQVEMKNDREINLHERQEVSGIGDFLIPMRHRVTQKYQSQVLDGNLRSGRDLARVKNDVPRGWLKTSSPFSARSADETPFENLVEPFVRSPATKELFKLTHNDKTNALVVEDVPSPKSIELSNGSQKCYPRKRRNEEIMLKDRDYVKEITMIQRSPKLRKGGGCDSELLELPNVNNSETSTTGHELKCWADIFLKFSEDIKQLLSPSICNLNLQKIDVLEDILVHVQRLKTYEMLSSEIQSQKSFDHLSDLRHARVAETRLMLHRIVHEQTKLLLMRLKREKLLKKVQLLSSGIQDCQMLKLSSCPQPSVPCTSSAQVHDGHPPSFTVNFEGTQKVAPDKLTSMGQALEVSDLKITNLISGFCTSLKMKGEPCSTDTIAFVNDYLIKRARCRFIRLDLQLWVVDSLESKNGLHTLVINYLGFIIQRLAITAGSSSSIVVTNKLNKMNILKNFPNMDASVAFEFVLNAETTRKFVGPRSLAQETQITSSLLGNLLDVVEEVQLARIELQNLIQTSFLTPCVEQLDLQFSFFDFNSSRKVILTLDLSCLNRGVYPSDIIPSQLAVAFDGMPNSLSQPLTAEIRDAVQSLRAGYLSIIRLCKCVSQVVQASSG